MDSIDALRFWVLRYEINKLKTLFDSKQDKQTQSSTEFLGDVFGKEYADGDNFEEIIALADKIASGTKSESVKQIDSDIESDRHIELKHILTDEKVYTVDYNQVISLLEDFKNEFKAERFDFEKILRFFEESLLVKIPAGDEFSDVSLFDHLRLVAALSNCIWNIGFSVNNISAYEFALISADVNRIGEFVKSSYRIPDLKAGSDIVKNATTKATQVIRDRIGAECIIFEGGGSILAWCAPSIAEEISKKMEVEFNAVISQKLSMTVNITKHSGDKIQDNFGKIWSHAINQMLSKKLSIIPGRFDPILEDSTPCIVCNRAPATEIDEKRMHIENTVEVHDILCHDCMVRRKSVKGIDIEGITDDTHLALIFMDGDRMGEILSGKKFEKMNKSATPGRIATISRIIDRASHNLTAIVQDAGGQVIYAGGDDLLCLLPGKNSFEVSSKLAKSFSTELGGKETASAGLVVFKRGLPIYLILERASALLKESKIVGNSITYEIMNTLSTKGIGKSLKWNEFAEIIDMVNEMNEKNVSVGQLRKISGKNKIENEIVLKYQIGRNYIRKDIGEKLLKFLEREFTTDLIIISEMIV